MLTINIDADGVLYDYSGEFWKMAREHYGRTFPPSLGWNQHEVMGIDEEEYWEFFHHCARNGVFRNGDAIPGGIESIRQWYKAGYRLRVVTHKSLRHAESTYHAQSDMVHWLHEQGVINKVELVFPKGEYHKQGFPADVVIDDKPDLKWAQEDAVNVLFDQPWNQTEDVAPIEHILYSPASPSHTHSLYATPRIYRAKGWDEVRSIVTKVEEQRRYEVLYH